ncbi:MAG TPA: type II toxin-antitoxin system antitoxin SocA domain-containing protein [Puia sp.]|nr:type II toxin-antitoxin system antitoxin SocA domain-containing protein [Puia sp.]
MENSLAIANYFIKKAQDSEEELTPMKLIKIVYIANGWYLALKGEPLIPEKIEAWKYGPVVKSVYNEFKQYSRGQIDSFYSDHFGVTPMPKDPEIRKFLDKIWEVYGAYNGLQLSALTHEKDTPWYTTWHDKGGSKCESAIISNDLIRNHYKSKLNPVINGSTTS